MNTKYSIAVIGIRIPSKEFIHTEKIKHSCRNDAGTPEEYRFCPHCGMVNYKYEKHLNGFIMTKYNGEKINNNISLVYSDDHAHRSDFFYFGICQKSEWPDFFEIDTKIISDLVEDLLSLLKEIKKDKKYIETFGLYCIQFNGY